MSTDPRTASMGGDKSARRQLEKSADKLFAELRPHEQATWVAVSATLAPSLVVLTNQRLLAIPLIAGRPVQTAVAPFTVEMGKKRLRGESVDVVNAHGARISLLLQPADLDQVQRAAGQPPAAEPRAAGQRTNAGGSATAGGPDDSDQSRATGHPFDTDSFPFPRSMTGPSGAVPGAAGAWRWGRPLLSWQDAELMAAAHITHLGFRGVRLTPAVHDGGLDVIAEGAAAQVKHHASPTGGPDVQQLRGAAESFSHRLFYATAYTPAALAEGDRLAVALFQFTPDGLVLPRNAPARDVSPPAMPDERGPFGTLTFVSRQNRAVRWAQQIEDATKTPISDRKRKGVRQLTERQQALTLMVQGLNELQDSDNPLYKRRRKERTLAQAEKTLKEAARVLRLTLK